MLSVFRPLIERVQALFAVSAAQELEADLLLRDAERRAELLRQADRYDAEGLHGIAGHLRQQAEALSLQQPIASVLPAVEHLAGSPDNRATPALTALPEDHQSDSSAKALPSPKKRGGKS
jgi:hypothetical protein